MKFIAIVVILIVGVSYLYTYFFGSIVMGKKETSVADSKNMKLKAGSEYEDDDICIIVLKGNQLV